MMLLMSQEINTWVGGVATNGIKFLPSFVENGQLVEVLKWGKQLETPNDKTHQGKEAGWIFTSRASKGNTERQLPVKTTKLHEHVNMTPSAANVGSTSSLAL